MIEVTKELILSLKSERGGYTKASLKKIGVSWPLKTGWKQRAIGTLVPDFRQNQKLTFIPELKSASEAGLTFRFEMTSFQIAEKPTAKSAKSKKPDHFADVSNKVEEEAWESLWEKGGHEWITECTPLKLIEDDPEIPPWKS